MSILCLYMQIQTLQVKEQLVKKAVKSGNGGAVWVPKRWLGQEVVVILPIKRKYDIKERIIQLLQPYLKDVIAVFLYGSYARKEETAESDIDVLILTQNRIKIHINEPSFEITVFQLENFKKALLKHPVIYYQIIQEAEPLINSYLLEQLKKIRLNKKNFKKYIDETKEHIKSNKELLELDALDNDFVKSNSIIYSIILRLKGIYISKCLIKKEKFSNRSFKLWITKKGITNKDFEDSYSNYRAVRDDQPTKMKIEISLAKKLLNILEKEIENW
jgi:predicted nucleotidyltransferase